MRFKYRALIGVGVMMMSHAMADDVIPVERPLPEDFTPNMEIGRHIAETSCVSCHGQKGDGLMLLEGKDPVQLSDMYPKLAGQHHNYIVQQLKDFQASYLKEEEMQDSLRQDANMMAYVTQPMLEPAPGKERQVLDSELVEHIAAYFSAQKPNYGIADEELAERGAQIYHGGDLERNIPACAACHSPTGQGNGPANYPKIAGQHATYTEAQLNKFKSSERRNDPARMMRDIAERLSDAEIKAVASYIEGLQPKTRD